jgi:hypothetical protein
MIFVDLGHQFFHLLERLADRTVDHTLNPRSVPHYRIAVSSILDLSLHSLGLRAGQR